MYKTVLCSFVNIVDVKRGTLKKAENPPGSESPLQFDTYTLNHAAFVGINEVCWRDGQGDAGLSWWYSRSPGWLTSSRNWRGGEFLCCLAQLPSIILPFSSPNQEQDKCQMTPASAYSAHKAWLKGRERFHNWGMRSQKLNLISGMILLSILTRTMTGLTGDLIKLAKLLLTHQTSNDLTYLKI